MHSCVELRPHCNIVAAVPLALLAGLKLTLMVAVCPGARICPMERPLAPKPGPARMTFDRVTLALPVLAIVACAVELAPMVTFPRARLGGLAVSVPV